MIGKDERAAMPIVVIIGLLSVSTASLFIKFAQEEAPSIVIAALRLIIATVLIGPFVIKKYKAEIISLSRKELGLIILSGLLLSIHFASWITSLEYTSVSISVVLVSTGPIWVAILAYLFLRETPSIIILIGIILSIIGVLVISFSDFFSLSLTNFFLNFRSLIGHNSALGNFLALIGAISVSGYLLIGRFLRPKTSLMVYIFLVYGFSAIFLSILMVLFGESPFGYSRQTYLWIFLLAIIPQLLGHSTYNWILKYISATLVALLTLGEPVGATILAYIFLREYPNPTNMLGIVFILIGIYLASNTKRNKKEEIAA